MRKLDKDLNYELQVFINNIDSLTTQHLITLLKESNFIESERDFKLLALEQLQSILDADDELPVKYYTEEEKMNPEHSDVDAGPQLTDDYIKSMFG